MTSAAIVETKLFVPRPRAGLVPRPRLDELLGAHTRLTLVSAPAGFGKSTLLTSWLATQSQTAVAWVSFDEGDSRPEVFWSYVLTALERAAPGTGAAGLALFESGQPIDSVLAAVLNELSVLPTDVILVLDDYHLAESADLQAGMALLVERLPPQVRLVIGTRADPMLPLARLRARGDLTEVRAADLRFTADEAGSYLAEAAGLALDATDVAALEARTEGWIASLQLAALSLRGRDDPSRFIEGFAGDDRHVVDYLVEEVLDRQPPEVRDFLLGTAVLDRLTGPLCDAVTETGDGAQMLESLERRNLFVVPLDDQRRWYRYHHLFADVLRAHVLAEQPERVPGLHGRASAWYDEAGEPVLAVKHALAAGDAERAADLMELANPVLARDRQEALIKAWGEQLPGEILRNRPVLAMQFVGGRMSSNAFAGVDETLQDIERQLALPPEELVFHDPDELSRIPAHIEMYRAALALNSGDPAGTIEHADRAASLAKPDDHLTRGAASALSGLAAWMTGDLDAAHRGYTAAVERFVKADRVPDVLGCTITLADLELTQGRLGDAERSFRRALDLAGSGPMRGVADMWVGLARVAFTRGDLPKTAELLRTAEELGEDAALAQNPYRWRRGMALLREAQGDVDAAVRLLDEAIRVYVGDYSPNVQPVAATRARVLASAGRVDEALEWARMAGVSVDDELSYLREYEHVTLARVLLASGTTEAALALLDRLLSAAEEGARTGTVMEILVLQALALRDGAPLGRALELAEKDGWIQVFAGEGAPMRELLSRVDSAFSRRILAAMGSASPQVAAPAKPDQSPLIDPLSERELEVLRLLASELDGPDIARHLVVSLNTVRTHTKHIYTKLDVNSRRSAVAKAHQLGLLTR
ncbi:MAG TPA: LuxR C-terminal-related transcriptional regulator [Nocardioidaceae bacterium]|nr:LuxR C-terminal-related transcriptional regulator [Nocardioidaceae bacterium]